MSRQATKTEAGILVGVLLFLLAGAAVAIFWQAQVIASQDAVIHSMEVPR